MGRIFRNAGAYLQYECVGGRAVLQAVTVGIAGLEARSISWSQHLRPAIADQRYLAAQNVDKLV